MQFLQEIPDTGPLTLFIILLGSVTYSACFANVTLVETRQELDC